MVVLAAEKNRSVAEDIARIDRISMARRDGAGSRVLWAACVHHSSAEDDPILIIPSLTHRSLIFGFNRSLV